MSEPQPFQIAPLSRRVSSPAAEFTPYELYRRAEELFAKRRYTQAAQAVEDLIAEPEHRTRAALELLARSYYHSAQLQRCIAVCRELREAAPTDEYVAVLLTRALERAGQQDEATRTRRYAEAIGATF